MRNTPLVTGGTYHIYNKSIAGFKIFNEETDFMRLQKAIKFYQIESPRLSFSDWLGLNQCFPNEKSSSKQILVSIIAYCIMPTHIHLILKQNKKDGIGIFMSNLSNSYSKFFNIKHKRKGPLWEGRFKNALVQTDEQLLHLTRYVHLNPVTAYIVGLPEEWAFSSYREYLGQGSNEEGKICNFREVININPDYYRIFVNANIDRQRILARIKHLLFDQGVTS